MTYRWAEAPLSNEGILEHLHGMQRQGRLRGGAMAYPLFDHTRLSDMASWARLGPVSPNPNPNPNPNPITLTPTLTLTSLPTGMRT